MKHKLKYILVLLFCFVFFTCACKSQGLNFLKAQCPSPNDQLFSKFILLADGNINAEPCPSGTFNINGVAVVAGGLSGNGTANFVPRYLTASTFGNTPFSWNNTDYIFNNTALNAQFTLDLLPSVAGGRFRVGDFLTTPTSFIDLNQTTNSLTLTGISIVDVNSGDGTFRAGDLTPLGNGTRLTIDDSLHQFRFTDTGATNSATFDLDAGTFSLTDSGVLSFLTMDTVASVFNLQATNSLTLNSGIGSIFMGDVNNVANRTKISITDTTSTIFLGSSTNAGIFDLTGVVNTLRQRTITAGGTTGAQTINKPFGTVNFAAAGNDIVVTNNTVTTTSLIFCTVQSLDTTAISCRVTDKAAGSFHIRVPAATAETSVAFMVTN